MQTLTEKTVREIALENPATIPVFESLGIDYCCGGKRPLSEACLRADVSFDRVLQLLERTKKNPVPNSAENWNDRPLAELIAHIVGTHHGFVRREIPRLQGLLAKVAAKHGSSHPETAQIERIFSAIGQELSTHMMKEEQVLFPFIERLERARVTAEAVPEAFFGWIERPIANMLAEHDDAASLLVEMRELSNGYRAPAGACPTFLGSYHGLEEFERDLHRHIHLENNILFPRAIALEQLG